MVIRSYKHTPREGEYIQVARTHGKDNDSYNGTVVAVKGDKFWFSCDKYGDCILDRHNVVIFYLYEENNMRKLTQAGMDNERN